VSGLSASGSAASSVSASYPAGSVAAARAAATGSSPVEAESDGPAAAERRLGLVVTHRRYVPYSHAHYGGNLVDGAYVLGLFGDVATEACIRTDGDEGLFASYSDVQFRAPVIAGDVLEVSATVTRVGTRSREISFEARVVCRAQPDRSPSAAGVLAEPIVAVSATGTVVVPPSA
jgi:3-aminobutyryl-CoA ammonia-lyase